MRKSAVSKEYVNLQKDILRLQEQWKKGLDTSCIRLQGKTAGVAESVPAAALAEIDFDISLFLQWIKDVGELLGAKSAELGIKVERLVTGLDEKGTRRWIDEACALNNLYFDSFAQEHGVEAWIPQFLAETALRPYLQLLAEVVENDDGIVKDASAGAGCPVCGEPVRLARLEGEGKKLLCCPRCLAEWNEKRVYCAHCGNDDHETISFLTVEGDETAQIQACEKCKGYTKVIDTRQFISKPSSAMLDLTTIHLDYIAQENGYVAAGATR
ncbi:formate dehydrogenase accessory protein FdhE [Bacillus massilinigeriensis]|uniref:formate dehydrogenase accessory protein FdhE n=1 Tax=Bacillus mediterraneensis TaxID=1805474 RepID=UPI0008F89946|nr:formate dehydrogenase accessory protein FdhE [Bacillus mediterraneensis]